MDCKQEWLKSHIWLCQRAVMLLFVVRCMYALNMIFWLDLSYACSQGSVDLWLTEISMHMCMTVPVLHALHTGDSAVVFALEDAFLVQQRSRVLVLS